MKYLTFFAYKHWEYHWLLNVQVEPATQVVGPVHPVPPHCPHLAAVPPVGGVVLWVGGAALVVVPLGGLVPDP